jgi:hypothetical protein
MKKVEFFFWTKFFSLSSLRLSLRAVFFFFLKKLLREKVGFKLNFYNIAYQKMLGIYY